MPSGYLRQISFWIAVAGGWLVTACILSVLTTLAGSHSFAGAKALAIGVAVHGFSAIAGFAYARARASRSR